MQFWRHLLTWKHCQMYMYAYIHKWIQVFCLFSWFFNWSMLCKFLVRKKRTMSVTCAWGIECPDLKVWKCLLFILGGFKSIPPPSHFGQLVKYIVVNFLDVQVVFLVKGPIYLVCISCTEEPYESLRGQLELIYGQVGFDSSPFLLALKKCFQD